MARLPQGLSEMIAEEGLRAAIEDRCRGGSWRGLARGLAWRVVASAERNPHSIESLAATAEAMLASTIDDALWAVEQVVIETWHEFLELRPGDEAGARAAMALDAREESARLVEEACERVVESLLVRSRRAA